MATRFLRYLLFLLEYQWNCFYGFLRGGQGQKIMDFDLFLATTTDFEIRKISISPTSIQPNVFHAILGPL
jgi:hypothetical protein